MLLQVHVLAMESAWVWEAKKEVGGSPGRVGSVEKGVLCLVSGHCAAERCSASGVLQVDQKTLY